MRRWPVIAFAVGLASCSKQLPVLTIDPLPNGGILRGVSSVTGSATEASGIRSVTLYVDAQRAVNASVRRRNQASAQWQAGIDATPLPIGVHYFTVLVRANDGRFTQETVTMIVSR